MKMAEKTLEELLPEKAEIFPVGKGVKVLRGKTLTKIGQWFKAIVLIEDDNKQQLRLYGWQKDKEGNYKTRQKFNMSSGYVKILIKIMQAFLEEKREV